MASAIRAKKEKHLKKSHLELARDTYWRKQLDLIRDKVKTIQKLLTKGKIDDARKLIVDVGTSLEFIIPKQKGKVKDWLRIADWCLFEAESELTKQVIE